MLIIFKDLVQMIEPLETLKGKITQTLLLYPERLALDFQTVYFDFL